MSSLVEVHELWEIREPLPTRVLNESVWQAWLMKGRAQDRRDKATRVKAATWLSIAALIVVGGLWSLLAPYDIPVRFILAAGAFVAMFHAFQARRFAFGAVFGALTLLYNPVVPVFSFTGDWQRAFVLLSAIPFVASLSWRSARKEHND